MISLNTREALDPVARMEAYGVADLCFSTDPRDAEYVADASDRIIRAYLAALPPPPVSAPEGWRPIETAPRDGTWFLSWNSHYRQRIARALHRSDHDDWLSYMDAFGNSSKGGVRATHWIPLPAAPKPEGE